MKRNIVSGIFKESLLPHKMYLLDKNRNEAYLQYLREIIKPDDVVLDVGSGTGILGFLALQAGCRKVFAVEQSEMMAELSKKIAAANGFQKKIQILNADIFNVVLNEKVDVIIHDQIGDFLWDEGMVRKIGHAVQAFGSLNVKVIPDHFEVYAAPCFIPNLAEAVGVYNSVCGLDFSIFGDALEQQKSLNRRPVKLLKDEKVIFTGDEKLVFKFNLLGSLEIPPSITCDLKTDGLQKTNAIMIYSKIKFGQAELTSHPHFRNSHWCAFALPIAADSHSNQNKIFVELRPSESPQNWAWQIS